MARKFHHSFEVCTCKHVTLGELIYTIKEKNAKSLEEIGEMTDAGTCCRSCISEENDVGEDKMQLYLVEILKKFNDEK